MCVCIYGNFLSYGLLIYMSFIKLSIILLCFFLMFEYRKYILEIIMFFKKKFVFFLIFVYSKDILEIKKIIGHVN